MPRKLTDAEVLLICKDTCPLCNQAEGFLRGPLGGSSINVYCKCGAGFNVSQYRAPMPGHLICDKGTPEVLQPWFGSPSYREKKPWDWIPDEFSRHYILGPNKVPVAVDLMTWARWLETDRAAKIVRHTDVGPLFISTVFLGLDHGFSMNPKAVPILFETMIFGADMDQWGESYMDRYATYPEAEEGHRKAIDWAKMKLATIGGFAPGKITVKDRKLVKV